MNQYEKARRHGEKAESDAEKLLQMKVNANHLLDILVQDSAIEVKSCRTVIKSSAHKKGWRWGRFTLNGRQHKELREKNGMYLFLIYSEDSKLIYAQLMSAEQVDSVIPINTDGNINAMWTKLICKKERTDAQWRGYESLLLALCA